MSFSRPPNISIFCALLWPSTVQLQTIPVWPLNASLKNLMSVLSVWCSPTHPLSSRTSSSLPSLTEKIESKETPQTCFLYAEQTHTITPGVYFIKLPICLRLWRFCDVYTNAHSSCVCLTTKKKEKKKKTDVCLAFGNPDSQSITRLTWQRQRGSSWRATKRRRARVPDKQTESEGNDLCGCELTYTDIHPVTLNKRHPHVRWRDPAGPAVCSLACASAHSRCCFPAPRSRRRRPSGWRGRPPETSVRTSDTPAHTNTQLGWLHVGAHFLLRFWGFKSATTQPITLYL